MSYRKKAASYKRRLDFTKKKELKPRKDAEHCYEKKKMKKKLLLPKAKLGEELKKAFPGRATKILISFHLVFSFSCH